MLSRISERVARRYHQASSWDGKFVGKNARLQWSRHSWLLEELPIKGKKKLKKATLQNPSSHGYFDWWIPGNILMLAKLGPNDDYADIKKKVREAYDEAYERTKNGTNQREKDHLAKSEWVTELQWYESEVFYLNVIPEGTEPFTAEGKDFSLKVRWDKFESYSPNSDFQQADPHYTKYESSSPTAARKLFNLLKANPKALDGVAWTSFGDWLKKNKVQYDIHHSQWS